MIDCIYELSLLVSVSTMEILTKEHEVTGETEEHFKLRDKENNYFIVSKSRLSKPFRDELKNDVQFKVYTKLENIKGNHLVLIAKVKEYIEKQIYRYNSMEETLNNAVHADWTMDIVNYVIDTYGEYDVRVLSHEENTEIYYCIDGKQISLFDYTYGDFTMELKNSQGEYLDEVKEYNIYEFEKITKKLREWDTM